MSDVVGSILATGAAALPRVAAAASAKTADVQGTATFSAAVNGVVGVEISPLAARMESDPIAGLVTQYLDNRGNVIDQIPSSLALTYLRAGLTADGMSRQHEIGYSSGAVFA
ncbi:MAG: hypothetical protein PHX43_02130 [Alphaproteobacteria bacterium]|nr:hypothetical protein [Alphaproteobacteria bacterium]